MLERIVNGDRKSERTLLELCKCEEITALIELLNLEVASLQLQYTPTICPGDQRV